MIRAAQMGRPACLDKLSFSWARPRSEPVVVAPAAACSGENRREGEANGNYPHGRFTCEAIEHRRANALGFGPINLLPARIVS
jgi:hypothetical protein